MQGNTPGGRGSLDGSQGRELPSQLGRHALYLFLVEDLVVQANHDGSARQYVVTPERWRSLGLNLGEYVFLLRVHALETNCGVTGKLQSSFGGQEWTDASSALISEKTATGDYRGTNSTSTELLPNLRAAIVCRDTVGSNPVSARISVWAYYLYRV